MAIGLELKEYLGSKSVFYKILQKKRIIFVGNGINDVFNSNFMPFPLFLIASVANISILFC